MKLVKRHQPAAIIVVADADEPGQQGAAVLARTLRCHCKRVTVIAPPEGAKDIRAWVNGGATREHLEVLVDCTEQLEFYQRNITTVCCRPTRKCLF